ncbi:hypothetical protein KAU11_05875, partial [Candidatus Babeliales bacterium]|nr:hypothetical protein [Candidatus Babeliales bacterium]
METKLFHFDTAGDSFLERRLVFVETGEDDSNENKTSEPIKQDSEYSLENMSKKDRETVLKFQQDYENDLYGRGGVDDVRIDTIEIKNVTLKTRLDLHHRLDNSTEKLLDWKVTKRLEENLKQIAEIYGKQSEKSLKHRMDDLSTKAGIKARIDWLDSATTIGSGRRAKRATELAALRELQKERKNIEHEEKAKLVMADRTNAESLSSDTGVKGLLSSSLLHKLLLPDELKNWKKSEEMRMLLFHLKLGNYRKLLDGGTMGGITTLGIQKVLNKDFDTEKDLTLLEEEKKTLEEQLTKGVTLSFVNQKGEMEELGFMDGLKGAINHQKDIIEEIQEELDKVESDLKKKESEKDTEAEQLENEWRKLKTVEEEASAKERVSKEGMSSIFGLKMGKGKFEEASNEHQKAKGSLIVKQDDMKDFAREKGISASDEENFFRYFASKLLPKKSETAAERKTFGKIEARLKKANDNLAAFKNRKSGIDDRLLSVNRNINDKQISKNIESTEKTKTFHTPREVFEALELELAKVSVCKEQGFKNTTELNKPENLYLLNQAKKIGTFSA